MKDVDLKENVITVSESVLIEAITAELLSDFSDADIDGVKLYATQAHGIAVDILDQLRSKGDPESPCEKT